MIQVFLPLVLIAFSASVFASDSAYNYYGAHVFKKPELKYADPNDLSTIDPDSYLPQPWDENPPTFLGWSTLRNQLDNESHTFLESEPSKTYSFDHGIELIIPLFTNMCSTALIRHPITNKIMSVTALHCTGNPDTFNTGTSFSGTLLQFENPFSASYRFGSNYNYDYSKAMDTFISEIDKPETVDPEHVFEVADDVPRRGDPIFFQGYKGGALGLYSTHQTIQCTYMGKAMMGNSLFASGTLPIIDSALDDSRLPKFTVVDYAYCAKDVEHGAGRSGGPVYDSSGQFLGAWSGDVVASRTTNMEHSIFVFSSMTKADFANSPGDRLLPVKEGRYTLFNVTSLGGVPDEENPRKLRYGAHTHHRADLQFKDGYLVEMNFFKNEGDTFPTRFMQFKEGGEIIREKIIGHDRVYLEFYEN